MKSTLVFSKTFLIGCIVLCVFIISCEVKEQRRPSAERPSDSQRTEAEKNVDTPRSAAKPNHTSDTQRPDGSSQEKITAATRIKNWLKTHNFIIEPVEQQNGVISIDGNNNIVTGFSQGGDMLIRFSNDLHRNNGDVITSLTKGGSFSYNNKIIIDGLGGDKCRISINGVGSAIFRFDANGQLQPTQ